MKRIFYFLCLICAAAQVQVQAQTRYDVKMIVDSVERQFIVVRPSGAVPAGGYPLVFMFHGTSQDGEKFYTDSQWKEKGEAEKFVTIFPTALRYCITEDSAAPHTTTKWNCGALQTIACPNQNLRDDKKFVRMMLDTVAKSLPINSKKIYASGFSNGGCFASKLAVEMSDVIAAVAVSGGLLNELDSAAAKSNIPVWSMVGTKDDKQLAARGLTEFSFSDTTLLYFQVTINRYLACFGLRNTYTKTSTARLLNYKYDAPAGTAPTTNYVFTLVNNMFHVYPDGSNYPIVAANMFWDYFRQYSLTSGVRDNAETLAVTIYPNPASTHINLTGQGSMTLCLRTITGQIVLTKQLQGSSTVQLPNLPVGLYFADIVSGKSHTSKAIIINQ